MDKLTNAVVAYMRSEHMLPESGGACLLAVGFSGGADSVCLLHLLESVKALLHLKLLAVHVNHGLRGAEAMRDEQFCRDFAAAHGILFQAITVDVHAEAARRGASTEEAARLLRYDALFRAAKEAYQPLEDAGFRVAAAHHADDQAETILLNFLRGAGLKGLSGMRPVRGELIRPLLFTPHEEILAYNARHKLSYVTDSSNFSDAYTRNRLRNTVLPLLRDTINRQAARHISMAGELCGEADAYLRDEARAWLLEHAVHRNEERTLRIPRKPLKEKPQILQRYVIIEGLHLLKVPEKDWGAAHFAAIGRALCFGRGFHLDLPGGVTAQNDGAFLALKAVWQGEGSLPKAQLQDREGE